MVHVSQAAHLLGFGCDDDLFRPMLPTWGTISAPLDRCICAKMGRRPKSETLLSKEVWRYLFELKNASRSVLDKDVWIPLFSNEKLLDNDTAYLHSSIALHRLLKSSIEPETTHADLIRAIWHMRKKMTKADAYIRQRLSLSKEQVKMIDVKKSGGAAGGHIICINFSGKPDKNSPLQDAREHVINNSANGDTGSIDTNDADSLAQRISFIGIAVWQFKQNNSQPVEVQSGRDHGEFVSSGGGIDDGPFNLSLGNISEEETNAPIVTPPANGADDLGFDFDSDISNNSQEPGTFADINSPSSTSPPADSSFASSTKPLLAMVSSKLCRM